ncbi:hypothetical protein RKD44_000615 [Streptomyces collinus]
MNCHDRDRHASAPIGGARRAATLVISALTAVLLTLIPWSGTAVAHGSVVDPASRNYGCWERWGDDFQNPAMADGDPMCWQAWQDNPNAMWNWNGLYRNGSAGDFQAVVPDGQLCSGGRTEGGRYNSLDTVGPWQTTDVSDDFTVKLYDQAGPRRRLLPGLRHQAGLRPRHAGSDLGLPPAGRADGQLRAQPELRDPGEHLGAERPARRLHDLAGVAHGPDVLPVQRRRLRLTRATPVPPPPPGAPRPAGTPVGRPTAEVLRGPFTGAVYVPSWTTTTWAATGAR